MPTNRVALLLAYDFQVWSLHATASFYIIYKTIKVNGSLYNWKPVESLKSLINPAPNYWKLSCKAHPNANIGSRIMKSYLHLQPRQTNRRFLHCFLVGLASQHHPWVRLTEENRRCQPHAFWCPKRFTLSTSGNNRCRLPFPGKSVEQQAYLKTNMTWN